MQSDGEQTPALSSLSLMLMNCSAKTAEQDSGDKTNLTIYLPDYSSFSLKVNINSSFREIIKQLLEKHRADGAEPTLRYDKPECYELRIHEGDGEPDMDFPPLELEKKLDELNLDECCLCAIDDDSNSIKGPARAMGEKAFSYNDRLSVSSSGKDDLNVSHAYSLTD